VTAEAVDAASAGRLDQALRHLVSDEHERVWLIAYVAAARGRFDDAIWLASRGARAQIPRPLRHRFALTAGSALRQTNRHREAVTFDVLSERLATTAEQRAHAWISLAADAVGLGDAARCEALLERAGQGARTWRAQVRWRWVGTELALLTRDGAGALDHARIARAVSARAGAVRHEAKSLLFEGVALAEQRDPRARAVLTLARSRAVSLGATPIARVAQTVLEHHPGAGVATTAG